MKKLLALAVFSYCLCINVNGQSDQSRLVTDTIYYASNWFVTTKASKHFYRVGTFHVDSLYFIGEFTDFFKDGSELETGYYGNPDSREGLFTRYYENGNLFSHGNYTDDQMIGEWEFYYENGKLKQLINFSEDDFSVLEYYKPSGRQLLKDGTGKWEWYLEEDYSQSAKLVGEFVDGKRTGIWELQHPQRGLVFKEFYSDGIFQRCEDFYGGQTDNYEKAFVNNASFTPVNHKLAQTFFFQRRINETHYPFFDFPVNRFKADVLPKPTGEQRYTDYLRNHIKYSVEARKTGIEGRIYAHFYVEKDGSLAEIKILKGLGNGLDQEVLLALRSFRPWNPAIRQGDTIRQGLIVPLTMNLSIRTFSNKESDEIWARKFGKKTVKKPNESGFLTDTLFYGEDGKLSPARNGEFYRVGTFHASNLFFVGKCNDYYLDGAQKAVSQYDSLGKKIGFFASYHTNGQLESKGNYQDNELIGAWEYYYENGALKERIEFEGGGFSVLDYYNEEGDHLVVDGTGLWKHKVEITGYLPFILKGKLSNGVRDGEWEILLETSGLLLMRETYSNGEFKNGYIIDHENRISYDVPLVNSQNFVPNRFKHMEAFEASESTTISNYPYLKFLQEDIFTIVENQPTPVGGIQEFYRYTQEHLVYPKEARRAGIEGRVYVEFIVEKDGSLNVVGVPKGIGHGCDEEAMRVVGNSPKWNAGTLRGKPARVKMVMPVYFKLTSSKNQDLVVVEDGPEFEGGMRAFYEYIGKNMKYPNQAHAKKVSGRVDVRFMVETDGSVSEARVVNGIGYGCDEEALRLIRQSPKWIPGSQRGKPVRMKMVMPVYFRLTK